MKNNKKMELLDIEDLTDEEEELLKDYSLYSFDEINQYLINKDISNDEKINRKIHILDNIFMRSHRTLQETILFRGIYTKDKYFLGKQKMYLSTSTEKSVALNFCPLDYCNEFIFSDVIHEEITSKSVIYVLFLPPGIPYIKTRSENEILLPRNLIFTELDNYIHKGLLHVLVKVSF
jgi:hypothetical protein